MSAMSASPVKPVLPPSGVTASPPKVAPPNTTTASLAPNIPAATCNIPGSPLKSAGLNHNTVSLSLISDNKATPPQPASVTVPSVQPLPRTPEKPKEAVPVSLNNISPRVTSNGVPLIAAPTPVPTPVAAPIPALVSTPVPLSTPSAPAPSAVPTPNVSVPNPALVQKQESLTKPEALPVKPVTENHASGTVIPPPTSAAAPPTPKPEPAPVKTTPTAPVASQAEKKLETPLPETKPEVKPEAKLEIKTPEKTGATPPVATPTPTATPVSATSSSAISQSSTSASSTPTTTSTSASSAPSTTDKTPASTEGSASKPEVKAATVPRTPKRKAEPKAPVVARSDTEERKSKRARLPTQPYQSPLPELTLITKMTAKPTPTKKEDDKLIVFYKNEFLAVRNAEGGFYVCQSMQNIYRSSSKIRIRWLSQDSSGVYIPDFYDHSDFECILTSLSLERVDKDKWKLPEDERLRTENILKRALDVEKGVVDKPPVTEEHPDGLDLSLFKDESQLKKSRKSTKKVVKKSKPEVAPKKDDGPGTSTPKTEQISKKKIASPAKTKKKPTPAKKKTPARNSGAATKPPVAAAAPAAAAAAKKPAETKKVAAKRKAPKTTSPSTSFSSLTPAEKRRKVIENLTKQVSTNERSTKTRRKI